MCGDSLSGALHFYYRLTPEDDIGWSMIQGVYDKVHNKAESVSVDEHRPDVQAAKRWYLKAASKGEIRAADALRRLMGL